MPNEELSQEEEEIMESLNTMIDGYNKGNNEAKALVVQGCFYILKDAVEGKQVQELLNKVENLITVEGE